MSDVMERASEFSPGDLVIHRMHGQGEILEEWGAWHSCRDCYIETEGETCHKCGGPSYMVSGRGIYAVRFENSPLVRHIEAAWLIPAPGLKKRQKLAAMEALLRLYERLNWDHPAHRNQNQYLALQARIRELKELDN